MQTHSAPVAQTITRKYPFRARKRVLSARPNLERDQPLKQPPPELNSIFSKKKKGGAPLGNHNAYRHGKHTREMREFRALIRDYLREVRATIALAKTIPVRRLRLTEYVQSGVVTRCKVVTRVGEDFCAKSAYKAPRTPSRDPHADLSRPHRRVQIRP